MKALFHWLASMLAWCFASSLACTESILLTQHNQESAQWSPDPFPRESVVWARDYSYPDHFYLSLVPRPSGNTKYNCDILYAVGHAPCDKKCYSEHQTLFPLFGRFWGRDYACGRVWDLGCSERADDSYSTTATWTQTAPQAHSAHLYV